MPAPDAKSGSSASSFALQDEIAASVVVTVEPQLYAAEIARVQQTAPDHLDAWDYVIRALSLMWRRTRSDNTAALDLLSAAPRLDPSYARALGTPGSASGTHMAGARAGSPP